MTQFKKVDALRLGVSCNSDDCELVACVEDALFCLVQDFDERQFWLGHDSEQAWTIAECAELRAVIGRITGTSGSNDEVGDWISTKHDLCYEFQKGYCLLHYDSDYCDYCAAH